MGPLLGVLFSGAAMPEKDKRSPNERAVAYLTEVVTQLQKPESAAAAGIGLVLIVAGSVMRRFGTGQKVDQLAPASLEGPVLSPIAPLDPNGMAMQDQWIRELPSRVRPFIEGASPDLSTYVDMVLDVALHAGASDLHIQPQEKTTVLTLRVHGRMRALHELPRELHGPLVGRLKVLSRVVHHVSDRPQDGHFDRDLGAGVVDYRASFLPTQHGERVVLRLARRRVDLPSLDALGITAETRLRLAQLLERPQGLVAFAGPVGSGKTTALYASLGHLHARSVGTIQVATIEDPIEHVVPQFSQTQVSTGQGLTFAVGLRALLRQDPDLLMVGEVRDAETAQIALQAGLTGQLVLTTVHAESAAGALARLADLQPDVATLTSSVQGCIALRLLPLLCTHCRGRDVPSQADKERLEAAGLTLEGQFFSPKGCTACDGQGVRGRVLIAEVLQVTPALREALARKEPAARFAELARGEGMRPLLHAGFELVKAGRVSLPALFQEVA